MSAVRITEKKKEIVDKLKQDLVTYPIIALVKIDQINARVVQQMRAEIRKDAKIVMAKNSLMRIAVNEVKNKVKGIEQLVEHIVGPCAFLLTHTNPFKLASYMDKNKVPAPAKAGQVAPNDVVVPSMNTGIPPGPVISELQALGLKTRIEGGQIKIVEDTVVTKEGERVNRSVALLLRRLNIDPFMAGLGITIAFEKGALLSGKNLIIDYNQYLQNIQWAYSSALNLAVSAGIVTKRTMPLLLSTSYQKAINLAVNAGLPNKRSMPFLVSKALMGATSVAQQIANINSDALSTKALETMQKAVSQPIAKTTKTKKEEKSEEPEEEEEEDLGLGSLFG